MKKYLALLVVLMMAVSLVACKSAAPAAEAPSAGAGAQAEAPSAAEAGADKVTIKYIGWRTEDQTAITAMNELFTAEYPNIEVVYEPIQATEYDTYLQTAIANGTVADVVMMRSYGGGRTVFDGGKILELTTENVPNLQAQIDAGVDAWTLDGRYFAVGTGMTMEGVWYNKDIFADCGITSTPNTVPELMEICKTIQDKGYLPIAGGIADDWYINEEVTCSILMSIIGSGDWVQSLYDRKINFTDPQYVQMLQTFKDLTAYYPDFYEGLTYEDCQNLFITGQAAMYMSGSFELQGFLETNPDLNMGCFAFPGQTAAPVGQNYTAACSAGVYADGAHVEEALTYVNWLASQEGGEAYANGVLGFFSPNPAASDLTNELAREWQALSNGKTMIHMLGYETMYDGAPDYASAIGNTVRAMAADDLTAEDAAAYMQDQMAWYFK